MKTKLILFMLPKLMISFYNTFISQFDKNIILQSIFNQTKLILVTIIGLSMIPKYMRMILAIRKIF